jgi:MFS family permease
MVGTVIGATIAGQLMGRIVHYKRIPAIGLCFATLGAGVLAIWSDALPLGGFEAVLAIISIGLGTVLPTTTVAIQNAVELHQLGTATGTMNFFRQLGSAVTVAIFGALLNASGISEATLHAGAEMAPNGFRSIFAATAVGFAVAFVFILWMKERPLRSSARHAAEAVVID